MKYLNKTRFVSANIWSRVLSTFRPRSECKKWKAMGATDGLQMLEGKAGSMEKRQGSNEAAEQLGEVMTW